MNEGFKAWLPNEDEKVTPFFGTDRKKLEEYRWNIKPETFVQRFIISRVVPLIKKIFDIDYLE